MTRRSRYFLIGSAGLLVLGLGGGLVAYLASNRAAEVPSGLPVELSYVPADAAVVAYADVRSVMQSELRQELERLMGPGRGQQQMHEFAGIDLEKSINHVVVYLQADGPEAQTPPQPLVLAQGAFNQASVEQFLKENGGLVEEYKGKRLFTRQPEPQARRGGLTEMAVGFAQPDLLVAGPPELVRRALDGPSSSANVTTDNELMGLIRDASASTAWVVGRFDAVSRRMGLPATVRQQVPPLRLVSASAQINGGVKATIKALTADQAAADQLRDVVRGAVSFVRLQAGSKPELQDALKSIELGGTGTNVQLSFLMTPATVRAIIPERPQPRQPQLPQPPAQPLPR